MNFRDFCKIYFNNSSDSDFGCLKQVKYLVLKHNSEMSSEFWMYKTSKYLVLKHNSEK